MKVAIESKDPSAICVQVTGKITQHNISPFREPLSDLLGPDVYQGRVLLDMSEVEVLDSSGVSWLLSCHKKFRTAEGNLLLHSLSRLGRPGHDQATWACRDRCTNPYNELLLTSEILI